MKTDADEIFSFMERVAKHPYNWAGSLQASHGFVIGLATAVIADRLEVPLEDAYRRAGELSRLATADVPHAPEQAVFLCEESAFPERVETAEATYQNMVKYIEILSALIRGK